MVTAQAIRLLPSELGESIVSLIRLLCCFFAVCLVVLSPCSAVAMERQWSPQALREDLRTLEDTIRSIHPDLKHSTGDAALSVAIDEIRTQLDRPMTRDEAWKTFSLLNPQLADGHLFVGLPDWRSETTTHLASGGQLFPFEVYVDANGQPFVKSLLGGAPTTWAGARINLINGKDARSVAAELLKHMHGDTKTFRTGLLSRRWWFFYWKIYGAQPAYDLALSKRRSMRVTLAGSGEIPLMLADEAVFDRTFRFEMLPGKAALLTIGSFAWEDEVEYFQFTKRAFEKMRKAGVRTLVIDLRENGGGNDPYWKKGILPYIAAEPYLWGSTFRKRVLEKYRDEGETAGEVISGALSQHDAIQPNRDLPDRFDGKIYVLVGPTTYSSSILFANVMQDYRFATVVGIAGAVRSSQTGGAERYTLPHTGLVVSVPRFVLDRPKPLEESMLFKPDIVIQDNPFQPFELVERLLATSESQRSGGSRPF
jgi:hypothetical protein